MLVTLPGEQQTDPGSSLTSQSSPKGENKVEDGLMSFSVLGEAGTPPHTKVSDSVRARYVYK